MLSIVVPSLSFRWLARLFWCVVGVSLLVIGGEALLLMFVASSARAWHSLVGSTGTVAWLLLLFTIFSSLLFKLFPRAALFGRLLPLRRDAGVLAFLLAVVHTIAVIVGAGVALTDGGDLFAVAFSNSAYAAGTVSLLIMLPLAVTSTNLAVRAMGGRAWKNLQRLAHVAFVLAALHIAFIKYLDPGPLLILAAYCAGYMWLWVRHLYVTPTEHMTH